MPPKILIFGVFDQLHDGHRHLIDQALTESPAVIVSITRDSIVQTLKHKSPLWNETKRMSVLQHAYPHITVMLGDPELNTWHIVKEVQPDIILLGYDQQAMVEPLTQGLKRYSINARIQFGTPFQDGQLHTSTLQ